MGNHIEIEEETILHESNIKTEKSVCNPIYITDEITLSYSAVYSLSLY